jgi:endogenous inhibitor of DNA gyrase (YacG/DUF329 family)
MTTEVKRSKTGKHYCTPACGRKAALKALVLSKDRARKDYELHSCRCAQCDGPIDFLRRSYKFCSHKCSAIFNNVLRNPPTEKQREKVSKTLKRKHLSGEIKLNRPLKKRIEVICPVCGSPFHILESDKRRGRKFCSKQCQYKGANFSNNGGYREHSGTSKRGWYKGIFCGSSWELAWVIFQLDHGLKFERNHEGFKYEFNGKTHKYYPDFRADGEYIEIKGYKKDDVDAKVSQFPADKKLKVMYKDDLKDIFDYVYSKYGKNLHELYGE